MPQGAESVELFGIMRRLPEIIIPSGRLAANKLSELVYNSSIISLYQFMGEDLEISPEQFIEGYVTILAQMNSEDGILTDKDAIVGYVHANDECITLSWEGHSLYMSGQSAPDIKWPAGTIILAPAFKPALPPVLPPIFRTKTAIRF